MNWWCAATGVPWSWEWQAFPGAWLFVMTIALSYVLAIRFWEPHRLSGEEATTRKQIVLFGVGVFTVWIAADWPLGLLGAGYLLSVKTLQYLLFGYVAPALLLLGTPRWLLRRLLKHPVASRAARALTRPLLPLAIANTVLVVTHLPEVVEALSRSQLGSFALDVAWILGGLVFWWPALGRLPELDPMSYPGRIGYLLLNVFVPTVPASFFTFSQYPIYALYELAPRVHNIPAIEDQRVAGLLMKVVGGLILFGTMSVMFFRWYAQEEKEEEAVVIRS